MMLCFAIADGKMKDLGMYSIKLKGLNYFNSAL